MRKRIIIKVALLLILIVVAEKGYSTSIIWSGFPDLVIKSDIIASGTISIEDGKVFLLTEQVLKGRSPKKLSLVVETSPYVEGSVKLVDNEHVLLFLKSIDISSAELTAGDLAKWPRADWLRKNPNALNDASPESIAGLVQKIQGIEDIKDIKRRIKILQGWFESSDTLLNIVALQYTLYGHIWSKQPSPDYQTSNNRDSILTQLSSYAFGLAESNSPIIQEESIRLLGYANPNQALPILINRIDDSNSRVRSTVHSALKIYITNYDMGEGFDYSSKDSLVKLLAIQKKWQEWYDARYGK